MARMADLNARAATAVGDVQNLFKFAERLRREDQKFPAIRVEILAYLALNEGATEPQVADLETLTDELGALGPASAKARCGHFFLRAEATDDGYRRFWLTQRGRDFVATLTGA